MEDHRTKSLNTRGGDRRVRFIGAKERSAKASADVYRVKRRGGSSSVTRENRVHNPDLKPSRVLSPHVKRKDEEGEMVQPSKKRSKIITVRDADLDHIERMKQQEQEELLAAGEEEEDDAAVITTASTFASELDLALDRNSSEVFQLFYDKIWPLVRSLPELLHHVEKVIDVLLEFAVTKNSASSTSFKRDGTEETVNLATTDALHLIGVLARDLRHEIHPYVHKQLIPGLIHVIHVATASTDFIQIQVVEAAFRALAYVFRYDSQGILNDGNGTLEELRQYYGSTLGNRVALVRRLTGETINPLLRKLGEKALKKHVRRVIRALSLACCANESSDSSSSGLSEEGSKTPGAQTTPVIKRSVQKVRDDAIDGVSLLLFHTARGVPGRLHSKGGALVEMVLDCLVNADESNPDQVHKIDVHNEGQSKSKRKVSESTPEEPSHIMRRRTYVGSLVSSFFLRVCEHMDVAHFTQVWDKLYAALIVAIKNVENALCNEAGCLVQQYSLFKVLDIMEGCASFDDGCFSRENDHAEEMFSVVERLLSNKFYSQINSNVKSSILRLLCSYWKAQPNNESFSTRVPHFLNSIVPVVPSGESGPSASTMDISYPAFYVAQNLLPHLPLEISLNTLIPSIISVAAKMADSCPDGSLILLHTVATNLIPNRDSTDDGIDDSLIFIDSAMEFRISDEDQNVLLSLCLYDATMLHRENAKLEIDRILYVLRCIPFMLNGKLSKKTGALKKTLKWLLSLLRTLDEYISERTTNELDLTIAKGFALEVLSTICSACISADVEVIFAKKSLKTALPLAKSSLFQNPSSVWAMRGLSLYVKASKVVSMSICESADEVFDALLPNLRHCSHLIRLYTLSILESFPTKQFVVDHADIDFSGDLDEEPSFRPDGQTEGSIPLAQGKGPMFSGACDLVSTLLAIEIIPINLDNERRLTSYINRVEVLGRSGSLPVLYAEAAANHMLGILSLKFAPIWPAANRAFVALASRHEACILQPLLSKVEGMILTSVEKPSDVVKPCSAQLDWIQDDVEIHVRRHACLCMSLEISHGTDIEIFTTNRRGSTKAAHVLVPKNHCTDEWTLFELVWGVMEAVPEVVAKNSKIIVPIFIEFLHYEYFAMSPEDPDVRELCLSEHVAQSSPRQVQHLGRKSLNRKLVCFLKAFAAIAGPQQLFKHKLLLGIFFSLLSNPFDVISQLAFDCVSRYKLPYLIPYKEQLQKILKKGELRDALMALDVSKESGVVEAQHRNQFIPILTRLLFGRLAAKGGGGKWSKDSPATRRRTVLAFFGKLAVNEGEIDYFIYLMVRVFVPLDQNIKCDYSKNGMDAILALSRLTSLGKMANVNDIAKIPPQKHIGFLNLLSDAISQLGYGVRNFVNTFIPVVLAMCEYTEVHRMSTPGTKHADDDSLNSDHDMEGDIEGDDLLSVGIGDVKHAHFGSIRSLCYQRLTQIFVRFASSVDFSPYGDRMWAALEPAVDNLPSSVVNSSQCPSLLVLLEDLSSHPNLIKLLAINRFAVVAAFKCIAATSHLKVMETSLNIVDNLLTEGGVLEGTNTTEYETPTTGRQIVADNLHLLVTQISSRLCSRGVRNGNMGHLAKKELSILCRVSGIIDPNFSTSTGVSASGDVQQETLEVLCDALVSFLSPERREKEEVQVDILRVLNNFLDKLSAASARKFFVPLSKLLGPFKSSAGIASPAIRLLLAAALEKITCFVGSSLGKVVSAINCLQTMDSRHVDEYDFEIVLPTLNKLGDAASGDGSWTSFVPGDESDEWGAKIILPLLYHCLHALYSSDGVLSRGAFKALKTLVLVASKECATNETERKETVTQSFSRVVETSMMPIVKQGILSKDDAVHKYFVQILCEVSRSFSSSISPSFCGDLHVLIREDDAELDFFLNVTHVQVHRRARALARLRRDHLTRSDQTTSNTANIEYPFAQSSLGNVLLPLALRPVYHAEKSSEEAYALEAVATVGAIARQLTWSKYDSVLGDLLRQFPRFPVQERFFIGAICSILDAFHFSVDGIKSQVIDEDHSKNACIDDDEDSGSSNVGALSVCHQANSGSASWKALNQRIIPRTEQLLTKHFTDKFGSRAEQLRSPIALALTKLFQKLPSDILDMKLPRLVLEVCTALRSRDSDCRDVARETLAKMAASLGVNHLSLIVKSLAATLTEGYQLHVRSATLHSVLLSLSKVYNCPQVETADEAKRLPFDLCIPSIMDLVQQDLFGVASEMKEVEHVEKRLVKEAMGSKSFDTLEIVCKCLLFRPSLAVDYPRGGSASSTSSSAVHNVVMPLLERLRLPDAESTTIGKIRESLTRVVVGLAQNTSVDAIELMPFVHATVAPFLVGNAELVDRLDVLTSDEEYSDAQDSDEDEPDRPLTVSRRNEAKHSNGKSSSEKKEIRKSQAVAQWHPSSLAAPTDCKSAYALNKMQKRELQRAIDGESAPKLTGRARYGFIVQLVSTNLNDPANVSAVIFGLSLLHSVLKKSRVDSKDHQTLAMADPFVPILTRCITKCENNDVVLLSLKLLGHLLHWNLPSMLRYQRKLASNVLMQLASFGGTFNVRHEITQGCFKALTLLFEKNVLVENWDVERHSMSQELTEPNDSEDKKDTVDKLPLSSEQMKLLISMLFSSVTDTEHHNSTFALIKSIVSRRFLSAEFYDLMAKILELSVQSLKAGVRQHASSIFTKFLINYPLDRKRLLQHLQQMVLNIKYEYEEGRLSAVNLLGSVVGKLPAPLLEEHGKMIFLPLILQLVNDESNSCREAVAHVISCIFQRSSVQQLQLFCDYMTRWFLEQGDAALSLKRTSAQLFGLLVDSRADFVGRSKMSTELVEMVNTVLQHDISSVKKSETSVGSRWETVYFCLVCFEKVAKTFPIVVSESTDVWVTVTQSLVFPHPWVKQVSCRIIYSHLEGLNITTLGHGDVRTFIVNKRGSLYQIARNVCFQMNASDDQYNEDLSTLGIKILTWISLGMQKFPQLCYEDTENGLDDGEDDGRSKDPLLWLITRLSNMTKEKGNLRRSAVFKCFASICAASEEKAIIPYLEVILEALHRSIAEEERKTSLSSKNSDTSAMDLPKEVMNLLEDRCGTEAFLNAYSAVKAKATERRMARKQVILSEAVNDPKAAATRKIKKQTKEKERKKRKIQERKQSRGVFSKKPRI